jgi:hypothetical protein
VALLQAARAVGLSSEQAADMVRGPGYLAPFLDPSMEPPAKTLLVVSTCSDGKAWPNVRMESPASLAEYIAKQGEIYPYDVHQVVDAGKIRTRLNAEPEGEDK